MGRGPQGQMGPEKLGPCPCSGASGPCGLGRPWARPQEGRGQLGSPLRGLRRAWAPRPARCWLDAAGLSPRPGARGSCWAGGCGRRACWQPLPASGCSKRMRRCAETTTTPGASLKVLGALGTPGGTGGTGTRSLMLSAHPCGFHMLLHGWVPSCATARGGPGLIPPHPAPASSAGNSSAGAFSGSRADLQQARVLLGSLSDWSAMTVPCLSLRCPWCCMGGGQRAHPQPGRGAGFGQHRSLLHSGS